MPSKAASKPPKAPGHLSKRSAELWAEIVSTGKWSGPRLAVLQVGLESLDRCDEVREAIDRQGLMTTTEKTGVVHVHPLLRLEASSRNQFFAAMEKLRLHYSTNGG